MKQVFASLFVIVMLSCITTTETSNRFTRFGKTNWQEKYKRAKKRISTSKVFNYGGGTLLTGASLYYINEKMKNLDIKGRLMNEVRQNPQALKKIHLIAEMGSQVILCDMYAPMKEICQNRITKELFKGMVTDPNPKTENLRKNLKQLTLENTKKIAKQGLKHFYLESTDRQKMALFFCGAFSVYLTTQAILLMWKNMHAGQLFFRSNLALSTLITGSTLVGSMVLDEEKIVTLAATMFQKNEDILIPVLEQLMQEGKEFTVQELKKRDAASLFLFNKNVFDRAMQKMDNIPLENVDTFIHHPEFKKIIDEFTSEAIRLGRVLISI